MDLKIKAFIIHKANSNRILKNIINGLVGARDYLKIRQKILKAHKQDWFLVLTPEHGNLGDHAIAQAEINFLHECGVSYKEITGRELSLLCSAKKLHLLNKKTIMINGGGNLGTLWIEVEHLIRNIIIKNPDSAIIIMPSTIYYDDMKKFYDSSKIYNSHKRLKIYAREAVSFEMMKDVYNNVSLVPDMVFSLNACKKETEPRSGCLLCLRSDCEKTLSDVEIKETTAILKKYFDDIRETDTVLKCSVKPFERKERLEEKFSEFRKAKLVVTDRLHGMIFCVITGTPCIVLNSKSPKLRGCYKWIKDLEYIFFLDNDDSFQEELEKAIITCLKFENCKYDNSFLFKKFENLKNEISRIQEES